MTSLQSYQSVTKHTKNVDVQIMYVPVCKTYCPYIKFTQNMNNFCSFIIFFPYQSDPNSTAMIGLVKHLSAPTFYKRKFVMSGGDNTTRKHSHCCHLYISWWREYYITDRLTHRVCLVPCPLDRMHVKNTSSI